MYSEQAMLLVENYALLTLSTPSLTARGLEVLLGTEPSPLLPDVRMLVTVAWEVEWS